MSTVQDAVIRALIKEKPARLDDLRRLNFEGERSHWLTITGMFGEKYCERVYDLYKALHRHPGGGQCDCFQPDSNYPDCEICQDELECFIENLFDKWISNHPELEWKDLTADDLKALDKRDKQLSFL